MALGTSPVVLMNLAVGSEGSILPLTMAAAAAGRGGMAAMLGGASGEDEECRGY